MTFARYIVRSAAEAPVEFQGDRAILNTNLAVSRRLIGYWKGAMVSKPALISCPGIDTP